MSKSEQVTISMDIETKEKAKRDALKILGKKNLSGYLTYLVHKEND